LKLDTRKRQYDNGPTLSDPARPRTRPGPLKFVNFRPRPGPCRTNQRPLSY